MNTHRWLQKTSLVVALALGAATAQAGAPMVKTSAPGYYRMMLGDFEITALSDGTVDLPVDKLLTNTQPGKVTTALNQSFLKAPVETSVNAYLVNTGRARPPLWQPRMGPAPSCPNHPPRRGGGAPSRVCPRCFAGRWWRPNAQAPIRGCHRGCAQAKALTKG